MATLHMQLDFPVLKGPLEPSNSTICPRTAPQRPPKDPEFVHIGRPKPKPGLHIGTELVGEGTLSRGLKR